MQSKANQDAEKGEGDDDAPPSPEKLRPYLVAVTFAVLAVPGSIMSYQGITGARTCAEDKQACTTHCETEFASVEVTFQSQKGEEINCIASCTQELERCSDSADSRMASGIILFSGAFVAMCVFYVIFGLLGSGGDEAMQEFVDPRPCYVEPALTEAAIREKEKKKRRAFWQDAYKPPRTIQHVCNQCQYKSDVDIKWMSAKKGGMLPAVCPRCRAVIAGII